MKPAINSSSHFICWLMPIPSTRRWLLQGDSFAHGPWRYGHVSWKNMHASVLRTSPHRTYLSFVEVSHRSRATPHNLTLGRNLAQKNKEKQKNKLPTVFGTYILEQPAPNFRASPSPSMAHKGMIRSSLACRDLCERIGGAFLFTTSPWLEAKSTLSESRDNGVQ